MPISSFKGKIADQIDVPVGQQRLIFRGKVLKDEHLLSEYHVENGDTLHLVERQPTQPQTSSGTASVDASGNNGAQDITEVLCELELNIQRVKVSTTPDEKVLDLFLITDTRKGHLTEEEINEVREKFASFLLNYLP